MSDFIWMNAPKVPSPIGTGMKNGGVTSTPWRRAIT